MWATGTYHVIEGWQMNATCYETSGFASKLIATTNLKHNLKNAG